MLNDLLNKRHLIQEVSIKRFTDDTYTVIKETKHGIVKVLKPQALREIKIRLGSE